MKRLAENLYFSNFYYFTKNKIQILFFMRFYSGILNDTNLYWEARITSLEVYDDRLIHNTIEQ